MRCPNCQKPHQKNYWTCPFCKAPMTGGIVFITGISGSGLGDYLQKVEKASKDHGHDVKVLDVGDLMHKFAREDNPEVRWDWILNADEAMLRMLRRSALREVTYHLQQFPDTLLLVDLHLSFRWRANLMKGLEPYLLEGFKPFVRFFVNYMEDLAKVKERLRETAFGDRELLELLIWRDEELFLTDIFAGFCDRVDSFAIAAAEPPEMLEQLIWHPEVKKVYLSFPITNLIEDKGAQEEIERFRDELRKFLVVFDPYASKDYDETYKRPEMEALRKKVGEDTEDRDYRFIDQADAVVVYFPKKVSSQGVVAEMRHAQRTGKPIYLYSPEDLGGGPFAPDPNHYSPDPKELIRLLRTGLSNSQEKTEE